MARRVVRQLASGAPGRGAGPGVGIAALAGGLYASYHLVVQSVEPALSTFLLVAVAAWLSATPAAALVGAAGPRLPRAGLVTAHVLAATVSVVTATSLAPSLFSMAGPSVKAAAVTAVGMALASALSSLWLTRPRTAATLTMRPGETINPAVLPRQTGGGIIQGHMGVPPVGLNGPSS